MEAPASSTSSKQPSVLIVDDEEGPRESIKVVLGPYYNIVTVDSAEVALEVLKRQPIDVVTLDLKLPGQQGIDFLQEIRKENKKIDVIIITGYGTLQSAIDAIRQGVAAYILKPFNVVELLAIVNQTFDRRRRVQSLQGALEALGNIWTGEENAEVAVTNIETLLEAKDPDLARHSRRVSFYSSLLGERLKLTDGDRDALRVGATLHDIGKFGVHDQQISGDIQSTGEDDEIYKCHPIVGKKMVEALPFSQQVTEIIRSHHERFDGTGFPDGLQGEQIPLFARIVGLANLFDHLITGDRHGAPLPIPEAREQIRREAGKGVDPNLSELFVQAVC